MRVLKPDMEALQAKYPDQDDAMQRQQETMKLYRDSGVNPRRLHPQLIQMPLLYAMFRFFPANIELGARASSGRTTSVPSTASWTCPSKSPSMEPTSRVHRADGRFDVHLHGPDHGPAGPSQPGMPDMRVMAKIMPFFMLFFFNKFASGLSLYYFIANLITIGQVTTVKKFFIDEDKIREKIKAKQAEPRDEKKKSSFAERLEAMQKEQQKKADEMKRQRDQARKARNQKRKK